MPSAKVKDFKAMLDRKLAEGEKNLSRGVDFTGVRCRAAEFRGIFLGMQAGYLTLASKEDGPHLEKAFNAAWDEMEKRIANRYEEIMEKDSL